MDFNNRLYQLRKQKGFSQEELANRLNVSRQTISKWEIGDSTPDMEKLVAISDLFDVSLDNLVKGKEEEPQRADEPRKSELASVLNEKVLTSENKAKAKSVLKIIGIIAGVVFTVEIISMIIYFAVNGIPS
ncbi:MAG: helix-turn-helix transcriptional regulator [Acutalibacteraceae bacterium]|mgnify:CR=1 FL=1|nr:helix-turn-helix transcriptional regulator [Acutalibacteraceae bacterium]